MNSWKFNAHANYHLSRSISRSLNIKGDDIYKTIKDIDKNSIVQTKDGEKYMIVLIKIKEE